MNTCGFLFREYRILSLHFHAHPHSPTHPPKLEFGHFAQGDRLCVIRFGLIRETNFPRPGDGRVQRNGSPNFFILNNDGKSIAPGRMSKFQFGKQGEHGNGAELYCL